MLNAKILCRIVGSLLFFEMGMFLLCLTITLFYKEGDTIAFAIPSLVSFFFGFVCKYIGRNSGNNLSRRDAFFIVAITWIIFSFVGMLPLLINGCCQNVTDAFFETMSGFTTTGSTVLNNIDSLPHGILFWRSLTHWVGGLGIIIFTMTLLPSTGESSIRLFSAEATGPTHEKLHPRIRTTLKGLLTLYFVLTASCILCLYICGMGLFDSINHAMSTTSTGGFSTHSNGIMFFHSTAIEYVEIFFMFFSGVNFTLLYLIFQKKNFKILTNNNEFTFYLACTLVIGGIAATALVYHSGYSVERAIRSAFFNVISLQTTTGFLNDNIQLWWRPIWYGFFLVTLFGGCAGSTSGGIKSIRILTLLKTATSHFRHLLHPNAFMPVRINHKTITESIENSLLAFLSWFIFLILAGTVILSIMGISFFDSLNVAICCISNIGVTDGDAFSAVTNMSALPEPGKWLCSFLMLAGRLEIFPLLLPLAPAFWENN